MDSGLMTRKNVFNAKKKILWHNITYKRQRFLFKINR